MGQVNFLGGARDYLASVFSDHIPQENILVASDAVRREAIAPPDFSVMPYSDTELDDIKLSAKSAYVVDLDTKKVLFAKSQDEERAIASLVKLMTAHLAIKSGSLNDQVRASSSASAQEPSNIDLLSGEVFLARDLLDALLIKSANDAAYALGEHLGKGSVESFVRTMNEEVDFLGLKNTFYVNPNGLDTASQKSTARDVATLISYLDRDSLFREITTTKEKSIASSSGSRTVNFKNSNKLLEESSFKIVSGKTGYTDLAGECLAVVAEIKPNRNVVAVILGSNNRFAEMQRLLEYIKSNYTF